MNRISIALIFIFLVCKPASALDSIEYRTFELKTSETVNRFWIDIGELVDGRRVCSFKKREGGFVQEEEYVLDENYATLSWKFSSNVDDTDYTGERLDKEIVLKGTFNGEALDKKITIGTEPLYVNPKLGLSGFVASGKKMDEFWFLRHDKLKVIKMAAKNQGIEIIKYRAADVETTKVYWAPKGIGAMFFKRIYWFRNSDNLYIRQTTSKDRMRELVEEN